MCSAPDLAGAVREAGRARDEHERGVVAGATAPVLAQPRAVGERRALRAAFARPAPGEVEQLGRDGGDGQREQQRVEAEDLVGLVGQHGPLADQPLRGELEHERQARAARRRRPRRRSAAASRRARSCTSQDADGEQRSRSPARPGSRPGPACRGTRPTPAAGPRPRPGRRPGTRAATTSQARRAAASAGAVQLAQVTAPVQDPRQGPAAEVDDEAHPRGTQVQELGSSGVSGHERCLLVRRDWIGATLRALRH